MSRKYYLQLYRHFLSPKESKEEVELDSLGLEPDFTAKLLEFGIINIEENRLAVEQMKRLRKFFRLRSDFGVNISAAGIILDLLERLEEMEREIERLRKR